MTSVTDSATEVTVESSPPLRAAIPATSPRGWSWTARILQVVLPTVAIAVVFFDMFQFALMIYCNPKNDFGRTFLSVVAFVHGEEMYGMNRSVPFMINDTVIDLWNLNPPHFHLVLLPLAWFSDDVALLIWMIANFICGYCAIRIVFAEVRFKWTHTARQLIVVGLLAFVGTQAAVLTGHMSFPLFLILTLAWRDARHGYWTRSAIAVALALSVKPFLLMLAPYYIWRRKWKAVMALVGTVSVCYLLGIIVFGVDNSRSWLERLPQAQGWAWMPMNASLMGMLSRSFTPNLWYAYSGPLSAATIKMIWLGIGVPLGILSYAAVARDTSPRGVDRAFGVLLLAALVLSPLGWTYYFPLALGPVFMLLHSWARDGSAWTWRQRLMAVAVPGLCAPLLVTTEFGQPIPFFTIIFGSIYFWSLLMVWLTLIIDGFCTRTRQTMSETISA